jgi:hypothetical protein
MSCMTICTLQFGGIDATTVELLQNHQSIFRFCEIKQNRS